MNLKCVVLGTVILFVTSCGSKQQTSVKQEEAVEFPTLVLEKQEAVLNSIYPATIKGQEDIEIRPHIDGFIKEIYIDEGSIVRKGQKLFLIDSPQADQALTTSKAAVVSAEAQLSTAKLNVDRIRPLAEKGIVSQVQLQTLENAYESAVAILEQAKASYANAQATKSWTSVTSPVDGVAGSITYRVGSLVSSANILTVVANTNNVFAYFSLNEKTLLDMMSKLEGNTQAEKIKSLPPLSLILADGSSYSEKGKIETINGVINTSTGSANFRAEFPNKKGILRSGTSGRVVIPKVLSDVYVIPQKATFAQQDKILVYKVEGDTTVQTIISVLPMPDGKSYAVTEGLNAGDRIIFDNLATVRNGMKIKVKDQIVEKK